MKKQNLFRRSCPEQSVSDISYAWNKESLRIELLVDGTHYEVCAFGPDACCALQTNFAG